MGGGKVGRWEEVKMELEEGKWENGKMGKREKGKKEKREKGMAGAHTHMHSCICACLCTRTRTHTCICATHLHLHSHPHMQQSCQHLPYMAGAGFPLSLFSFFPFYDRFCWRATPGGRLKEQAQGGTHTHLPHLHIHQHMHPHLHMHSHMDPHPHWLGAAGQRQERQQEQEQEQEQEEGEQKQNHPLLRGQPRTLHHYPGTRPHESGTCGRCNHVFWCKQSPK